MSRFPTHMRWAALVLAPLALASPPAYATCADTDNDGLTDPLDNCPDVPNPDQLDGDQDGAGAACDCNDLAPTIRPGAMEDPTNLVDDNCDGQIDEPADVDGDGLPDDVDNCPYFFNPDQTVTCVDLAVVAVWPPANCAAVPPGAPVVVRFNRPLDPQVVAAGLPIALRPTQSPAGILLPTPDALALDLWAELPPLHPGELVTVALPPSLLAAGSYQWQFRPATLPEGLTFGPGQVVAPEAGAAEFGDFDGDGRLDALIGGMAPNTPTRVYRQDVDGSFVPVGNGVSLGTIRDLAVGDVDGDGDLDVLAAVEGLKAHVLLNDGTGALSDPQGPLPANDVREAELADLDADGLPDGVLSTAIDNGSARFFQNVGGGNFAAAGSPPGGAPGTGVRATDLDADGDLDLVFSQGSIAPGIRVLLNQGVAGYGDLGLVFSTPRSILDVEVGDLDGDGRSDIWTSLSDGTGVVLSWTGAAWNVRASALGGSTYALAAGDMDGDGLVDALQASRDSGWAGIFLNVSGQLQAAGPRLGLEGQGAEGVAVGDVNGDGHLDVLVAGRPALLYTRRVDQCPGDPAKFEPGLCGCGLPDVDTDADQRPDCLDNCPATENPGQEDLDADGLGDPCDPDADNDGAPDGVDPDPADPSRCGDVDGDTCDDCTLMVDGLGPASDVQPGNDGPDGDGDGLCDVGDPCPEDPRPQGIADADADGVCELHDNCPATANPDQTDQDGDGLGDACDPCPFGPGVGCGGGRDAIVLPPIDAASPPADAALPPRDDAAPPLHDATAVQRDIGFFPIADLGPAVDLGAGTRDARSEPARDAVIVPAPDARPEIVADAAVRPNDAEHAVDGRAPPGDSAAGPIDAARIADATPLAPNDAARPSDLAAATTDAAAPLQGLRPLGGGGCTVIVPGRGAPPVAGVLAALLLVRPRVRRRRAQSPKPTL